MLFLFQLKLVATNNYGAKIRANSTVMGIIRSNQYYQSLFIRVYHILRFEILHFLVFYQKISNLLDLRKYGFFT